MSYTTRLPSPEFAGRGGGPSSCFPLLAVVPGFVPNAGPPNAGPPTAGPAADDGPPDDVDPAPVEADGPVDVVVVGTGVVGVEDEVDVCTEAADGCS
jgi:hypothetical protein